MEDYKSEIQQTRKGCLGSSDGKTLLQIASLGEVPIGNDCVQLPKVAR